MRRDLRLIRINDGGWPMAERLAMTSLGSCRWKCWSPSSRQIRRAFNVSRVAGFAGFVLAAFHAEAQPRSRSSAYLPFSETEPARYNLKWGSLRGRVDGSVQIEANDNINLANKGAETDLSIGPQVSVGFVWQATRDQVMQFDTGLGYRWYANHPSISSINIACIVCSVCWHCRNFAH